MKKLIATAMMLCVITGCYATVAKSLVGSVAKPKAGIDASVNGEAKNQIIGQKTESTKKVQNKMKTGDNSNINQSTSEIKSETTNKSTNMPAWAMVLMCLGWIMPGPKEVGKGIIKLIRVIKERPVSASESIQD